jgi:hypothetical protein
MGRVSAGSGPSQRPGRSAEVEKGDLATYAEKQIAGTGWLPAILRRKEAA